ncbi:MAG: glycosyltransferase family 4 protein, partial [Thiogranum sp.]
FSTVCYAVNVSTQKIILFLVTEDWYFCLHRLPVARAARDAGFRVLIATQVDEHGEVIEREGFTLIPMRWRRRSLNPLHALSEVRQIAAIYRKYSPDLVHHVALKPSLLGSFAANITRTSPVINNLAGLGLAFSSKGPVSALVRAGVIAGLKYFFRGADRRVIVENEDDAEYLVSRIGLDRDKVTVIRGIGVDVKRFSPSNEAFDGEMTVTLVSRMLWPKGIGELVKAADILRGRGPNMKVQLVGKPDTSSRVSVTEKQLLAWQSRGQVDWLGYREDIPELWRHTHIAVLPSYYREGVPRCLLEAAACGCPIVTTDMPGCRDVVRHGINGLLVPPRDPVALADALERLIDDPEMRRLMGREGRKLVEEEFTEERVVKQTLDLYLELVNSRPGDAEPGALYRGEKSDLPGK